MHVFGTHDEQTLAQLRDVASRAVKAALMSDGHVGYVMPIGGVAAYRNQVSVVGVGFDIACLAAGTPVTTRDGSWLPIESVEAPTPITCWDTRRVRPVSPNIGAVARGVRQTVNVRLTNGRTIRATPDHEVLTEAGWRRADALTARDYVACPVFVGLPYEAQTAVLAPPLRAPALREQLAARGLYPLRTDSPLFPTVVRLLGYVSGDGHLTRNGKRISVYTTSEVDAADIAGDFAKLGVRALGYRRQRGPRLQTEVHVCVNSVALHALFEALGSPVGRTCWPADPMPWLFAASPWVRAHFLSAFCSAEMMTPRLHANGTVPNLQLKQAGHDDHAIRFVASLLASLGYAVSVAPSGPAYGGRQVRVLQILGGQQEQLRFLQEVGFCYAHEKRVRAAQVASVVWQRARHVRSRDAAKAEARRPHAAGVNWRKITAGVSAQFAVSRGSVYHSIYGERGPSRRLPRAATTPRTTAEICWVPVESVEAGPRVAVYDVLTADPAQCFFANGIVVHNCGNAAIRTDKTLADLGSDREEVTRALTSVADEVAATVSFGVGRKNRADDAPVDHPLFDDPAWDAVPAKERKALRDKARSQLGTVGSGNHYVDVFADETGTLWVGVHFGSRGFGHAVASAFLALGQGKRWGERAPEREVLLGLDAPVGHDYWHLMNLAGRYAYAGREWVARKVVSILGANEVELVHNNHNFGFRETHDGEELIVVRKGATPAFPGQKGFIGGSMGDDAVIVQGATADESKQPELAALQRAALYSTVHGAGRVMSRTEAAGKRKGWGPKARIVRPGKVTPEMMQEWIKGKGVILRGGGLDESPHVYRRLPEVLAAQGGTVEVLHTLSPLVVVMAGADEYDPYKD